VSEVRDMLDDFHGTVGALATDAPDEIPWFMAETYPQMREFLLQTWSEIKPKLKRDGEKINAIDRYLDEGFALFDQYEAAIARGEAPNHALREKGRNAFWAIYNGNPSKLR
jgi:hypothetical protein